LILEGRNLSSATIDAYSSDAKQYLDYFKYSKRPLSDINSFSDLDSYKQSLSGAVGDNSLRRKVISLKLFVEFVLRSQYKIEFKQPSLIPARIESSKYDFEESFLEKCLHSLNSMECQLKKNRDIAIIHLLALEGLKVSEIIELEQSDLAFTDKKSIQLTVRGKRSRSFFVMDSSRRAISDYLVELENNKNIDFEEQKLFIGMKGIKLGKILASMTRHGVKFFINELSKDIHINLSAEKLRQHAIWFQVRQGKDVNELMRHFGLRQPGLIMKYLNTKGVSLNE
jgi:site-specific recombinase XerD